MEPCHFKPGDIVTYTPSVRGRGLVAMTSLNALRPGAQYVVSKVKNGVYVVLKGFENEPSGGLYWTEFTKAD